MPPWAPRRYDCSVPKRDQWRPDSAVVTRDAASSTLGAGATSLSLFIGNNRARKPLIAPNRFMTQEDLRNVRSESLYF